MVCSRAISCIVHTSTWA